MRVLRARGSVELRKVAFGSATQGLAEKRKSEISGKWHRLKWNPCEKNSWESQERRKTRKESRRESEGREYTELGLDLSEREKHVVCHVSALALAMTDEARQEAEM